MGGGEVLQCKDNCIAEFLKNPGFFHLALVRDERLGP